MKISFLKVSSMDNDVVTAIVLVSAFEHNVLKTNGQHEGGTI